MAISITILSLYLFVLPLVLVYFIYKLWKQKKRILSFIFITIWLFLYAPIICDIGCQVCGLKEERARFLVVKDLKSKKLDLDKLMYIGHSGSCQYSYKYYDGNRTIDYTVLSTWLHGVKLNFYDSQRVNKNIIMDSNIPQRPLL